MLALGIILVLAAAAVVLAAVFGGATVPLVFELGAFEVRTTTFSVFLAGALTLLTLVVGLAMIRSGVRRARRRRQEKKELTRLAHRMEATQPRDDRSATAPAAGDADRTVADGDTTKETGPTHRDGSASG